MVTWRRLVCNNHGFPKWIFIPTLAACGNHSTRHRLAPMGYNKKLGLDVVIIAGIWMN